MRLLERLFRLALRAFPRARRRDIETDSLEALRDGLERRLRHEGIRAAVGYGLRAAADALTAGVRSRPSPRARESPSSGLARDAAYAARRLRRAPGVTAAGILLVALGVGVNATTYSVFRRIVLADPPVRDAREVVVLRIRRTSAAPADTAYAAWSYPKLRELRSGSADVFAAMAGYAPRYASLSEPGEAVRVRYELVTPAYFRTVGARPARGRFFTREEEGDRGVVPVVVLSYRLWLSRFGGAADVVGRQLTLDGSRLRIIGVAERGFEGLTGSVDMWLPLGLGRPNLGSWTMEARDIPWLDAVARLAPGVPLERAAERVSLVGRGIEAVEPSAEAGRRVDASATPLADLWTSPKTRRSIALATGASSLLLVIVALNLGALLLAKGRRESRTTAVHLALGAGRWRMVRLGLLEGCLLTTAGGAVGIGLAALLGPLAGSILPETALRGDGHLRLLGTGLTGIDPIVSVLGLTFALLIGLGVGAGSALLANDGRLVPALRGASRTRAASGDALGRWLLAGQIGVTTVLLVGAGLLIGTIARLHDQQRGFDPAGFVAFSYALTGRPAMASPEATRAFHEAFRSRIEALPEVRGVSMGTSPPLAGPFVTSRLRAVEGRPEVTAGSDVPLGVHVVDHAYFRTIGARLLAGREFDRDETRQAENVVILNETAARAFFGSRRAVGGRIRFQLTRAEEPEWWTVVGVAEDILHGSPNEGIRPEAYVPLGIWAPVSLSALVRTAPGALPATIRAARIALAEVDPAVPFSRILTGGELRSMGVVADTQAVAVPLAAFGLLALLLAATGLWASVARAVTERRAEIGVRMALGAPARRVQGLMVRRLLVPVLGGSVVGVACAVATSGMLSELLYGVGTREPVVYAAVAGVLLVVAAAAAWIPSRRATRVDPVSALAAD